MKKIHLLIIVLFFQIFGYSQNAQDLIDQLKIELKIKKNKPEKIFYKTLLEVDEISKVDDKKAASVLVSILPLLQKQNNDTLQGLYYRVFYHIYNSKLEPDNALVAIEKSIKFYNRAKDFTNVALSTMNKGNIYMYKGDNINATKIYLSALALSEKHQLLKVEGLINKNLGVVFMNQEKFNDAFIYSKKAVFIFKKLGNLKEYASALTNLGNCYFNTYDAKNAIKYYKEAMSVSTKINDSVNIGMLLNNIGTIYIEDEKDTIKGLNYLLKSLEIKIKTNEKNNIIFQYNNLAQLYASQKKYNIATEFLDKSFEMSKKSGNLMELKVVYKIYSTIYRNQNNFKKAYEFELLRSTIKDSLLNLENLKAVKELETKYQTAKKEKLLIQKEAEAKKRNQLVLGLALFSVLIGLIGFLIYRQQKLKNQQQSQAFELKQAINQIETQNKLQSQRLAISKDLHDNIGAQLTFIISSVETAKFAPEIENTKLGNKLTKISDFTKDTIVELRDTIWAMNSNEISFEDLQIRISNFIEKASSASEDIAFDFNIDKNLNAIKLTSIIGMNIYRTIQEAINNALKYAKADKIAVNIFKVNDKINIEITDNGIGFDKETIVMGNGLQNMQKRIEEIDRKSVV